MNFKTVKPDKSISLFVKSILVFEENETDQKTVLPFFADGYPGLICQETTNGLLVNPQNKLMPTLFLYGQTIHPIELAITGEMFVKMPLIVPYIFCTKTDSACKRIQCLSGLRPSKKYKDAK